MWYLALALQIPVRGCLDHYIKKEMLKPFLSVCQDLKYVYSESRGVKENY